MTLVCIGDAETVRGFRLAGVESVVVGDAPAAAAALSAALARNDCGLVLLARQVADLIRAQVEQVKQEQAHPLIAEV